jgi:hypothetical protein
VPPTFYGLDMEMKEDTQAMRNRALAGLSGYVGSRISRTANKRLGNAVSKEELSEKLPSATYIEWCEGGRLEGA